MHYFENNIVLVGELRKEKWKGRDMETNLRRVAIVTRVPRRKVITLDS